MPKGKRSGSQQPSLTVSFHFIRGQWEAHCDHTRGSPWHLPSQFLSEVLLAGIWLLLLHSGSMRLHRLHLSDCRVQCGGAVQRKMSWQAGQFPSHHPELPHRSPAQMPRTGDTGGRLPLGLGSCADPSEQGSHLPPAYHHPVEKQTVHTFLWQK